MTMKPFQGVLLGIVLFLASFVVLYMNEGRTDFSRIAKKAVVIQADAPPNNTDAQGLLVSASGTVGTHETIGDDLYLKPGSYLQVQREVEMYSWVENSEETTTTKSDGSQTTETTYTYSNEWVGSPTKTEDFHEGVGHVNPPMSLNDLTTSATEAWVEAYYFVSGEIDLPTGKQVVLTADKLALTANATRANDTYVYVRNGTNGTYATPEIGDLRVGYRALPVSFEGTVFGRMDNQNLRPYVTKKGDTLYRAFEGSHDQAVAQMHGEYKSALWAFRLIGFLMMWFGIWAFFGPLSSLMSFIPVVGGVGKAVIGFISFAVSFVLSAIAIVVFAILHNIFAVIIVCVVILAAAVGSGKLMNKNKAAHKIA